MENLVDITFSLYFQAILDLGDDGVNFGRLHTLSFEHLLASIEQIMSAFITTSGCTVQT